MTEGIKILDDTHSYHWNKKKLLNLDYDFLRDMFLKS